MAAKDLDSDDIKKQEVDDITTCCICTEVYTDPKALPCIHTFCMKCIQATGLKTKKGPGDEMPCPICRRLFKIPPEGFQGLPKHFFIERLIQVSNVSATSATPRAICDACLEDENEGTGKEIPAADKYCVDCKHKLCEECSTEHRKFKLTKNHKLILLNEHEGGQKVTTDLVTSACQLHEQNVLNVYCADCKTVVCAICFIDDHGNHKGSHVKKFVDDFRKQLEGNFKAINECKSKAETKKAELQKVKEDIQDRVGTLECDIANRKDEVRQLTDKHAASRLQDLCSIRQSKLKEIQLETDDIDTYLSSLETYNSYCQNIIAEGSASDICRAFSDLSARAVELQQQCQPTTETEIQSFNFCFRKSELEQFLEENCDNLIGEIQDEGESKQKKRTKERQLAEQSNEIDRLRKEIENERTEKESLRSANEQLRIRINNEVQANKAYKATIKTLEENVEKLRQELMRMKQGELRYKSDPVSVQTIKTKAAEEEKKAILGLTILDKELFVVSEGSSEVEVYDSIKLSFSRRWNLKELIDPRDMGSCNRNKCLYIFDFKVAGQSMEILRADPSGKLIKKWSTGDDFGRLSVTSESNIILTVYFESKLNEYSPDGQLIRQINLSSGVREPWHAIKLTNDHFVVSHGIYADGVDDGHEGDDDHDDDHVDHDDDDHDDLQRVCIVDTDGKLKKSFGGERGSTIGQTNEPVHLSVDRNGFVMVADRGNQRVLLLNSDLEFKREILSEQKHGLRYPSRILLDESHGRLFVADNEWDSENEQYTDGRILIFDF